MQPTSCGQKFCRLGFADRFLRQDARTQRNFAPCPKQRFAIFLSFAFSRLFNKALSIIHLPSQKITLAHPRHCEFSVQLKNRSLRFDLAVCLMFLCALLQILQKIAPKKFGGNVNFVLLYCCFSSCVRLGLFEWHFADISVFNRQLLESREYLSLILSIAITNATRKNSSCPSTTFNTKVSTSLKNSMLMEPTYSPLR